MTLIPATPGLDAPVRIRLAGSAAFPVIVSVPHAGHWLPQSVADQARAPLPVLARLSDPWADLIAAPLLAAGASLVTARLARAVADCNRHEGDMDPADLTPALRPGFGPPGRKARAGLGVVPTRLPGAGPLWRHPLSAAELDQRLEAIHRPYHRALDGAVQAMLRRCGQVVLIDLHSMPSLPIGRADPRPAQIVLGDRFGRSAAPMLAAQTAAQAAPSQARIAINQPYAGGHIIERHGRPHGGVHAVQVEFDRQLYLDGAGLPVADRALALGDWLCAQARLWCDLLADRDAALMAAE